MQKIQFTSRKETIKGYEHPADSKTPAPVILMCHGFTGNCSEHGLFDDFGEAAAKAGYHVIRIDCAGSGESSGDFAELTSLGGWAEDLRAAMDFAATRPNVDPDTMITMGISMGGAVAMLVSTDPRVKAAVGLAPVIYPKETFTKIFSKEKWEELRTGTGVHCEYAGSEFDAGPQFLKDAETLSVEEILKKNRKPILLRFGTEDDVIGKNTGARVQLAGFPEVHVDIVDGEDHGCMNAENETISIVLDFLKKTVC